jgi:hypothetical protein
VSLPPSRMVTTFFAGHRCAVCGRDWPPHDPPYPGIFTEASIDADDVPAPVCDYCVEEHDPELFDALLADRRRFMAS